MPGPPYSRGLTLCWDFRPRPLGGPRHQRTWTAVPTRQGCVLHVKVTGTEPKRLCLHQALMFTFCLSQGAPDTGDAIFPMATVLSPCREGQAGAGRQAQCPHAQTNTGFFSSLVWKSLYGGSSMPPPRPPLTPTKMWRPLALPYPNTRCECVGSVCPGAGEGPHELFHLSTWPGHCTWPSRTQVQGTGPSGHSRNCGQQQARATAGKPCAKRSKQLLFH